MIEFRDDKERQALTQAFHEGTMNEAARQDTARIRRDIATACLAGLLTKGEDDRYSDWNLAQQAVSKADSLLQALEEKRG